MHDVLIWALIILTAGLLVVDIVRLLFDVKEVE